MKQEALNAPLGQVFFKSSNCAVELQGDIDHPFYRVVNASMSKTQEVDGKVMLQMTVLVPEGLQPQQEESHGPQTRSDQRCEI